MRLAALNLNTMEKGLVPRLRQGKYDEASDRVSSPPWSVAASLGIGRRLIVSDSSRSGVEFAGKRARGRTSRNKSVGRQWLVIHGEQRGFVWDDLRADNAGIAPVLDEAGATVTFADWSMGWLDSSLGRAGEMSCSTLNALWQRIRRRLGRNWLRPHRACPHPTAEETSR